jgi:predicted DNA-binding transcriptional regulator YafY
MRQGFRNFRLDRMAGLRILDERYPDDPARGLRAFLASVGANPDAEV